MSAKHAASNSSTPSSSHISSSYGNSRGYRPPSDYRSRLPKEKHTARNVVLAIVIIVAILIVCAVSLVMSARSVMADAVTLQSQVSTFQTAVKKGDSKTVKSTVQEMSPAASDMNSQMSNPLWKVATIIPVYGSDVQNIIDLASISNDLVNGALVPITEKTSTFDLTSFINKDGSINVKKMEPAVQALGEANAAIQRSNNTLTGMGDSNISQLNKPIKTLKGILPELASTSRICSELSPVLGNMLGAHGQRTYLLVAQNNVEMRSDGGFPGSMGPITVKNGVVSLGEFKSVYKWIPRLKPNNAVSLTAEQRKIFSKRLGYIPGDVGQIPDYSQVAQLWNAQWNKSHGNGIDGIISMDPVFLQDLLKLTGGFTASNNWKVDGNNAAEVLMNRSYLEMPIEQTDAFFAEVAGQAFTKVKNGLGSVNATKLVDTINDGVEQHRLQVWMKDSKEEAALQDLGYSGQLSSDITDPVLGIYTSDYAWSKISWYLDENTSVTKASDNADGSKTYDVTVTLKDAMTEAQQKAIDAAGEGARGYIFGNNNKVKRNDTDMVYFFYLVAPAGGSISDVKTSGYFGSYSAVNHSGTLDGKKNDRTMARTTFNGHELWGGETQIERGQQTTVSFKVTTAAGSSGELSVDHTPAANPNLDWSVSNKK
jgi:hypothetical protein